MSEHRPRRSSRPAAVLAALAAAVLLAACAPGGFVAQSPRGDEPLPPDSTRVYSLFLIGDAGAPHDDEPVLRLLGERLAAAGEQAGIVFLGDNIYPDGLPADGAPLREQSEDRIDRQIDAVDDVDARVVFIPGNHDWGGGLGGDLAAVIRQERYVEGALEREEAWLPDRGSPGPAEVVLHDSLALVVLDTQWWLQANKDYSDTDFYELEGELDFLVQLDDVLTRHAAEGRRIVVAGHHPLFSNGEHGGRFVTHRRLPFVSLSRRYLGTPQDLSNLRYRRLREGLTAVFEQHPGLVYAAGHEHNLQYFRRGDQHYVVSGSGSKESPVTEGGGASFVSPRKGYATLDYYDNGSVWLSYWVPEGDGSTGTKLYEARLEGAPYTAPPSRSTAAEHGSPAAAGPALHADRAPTAAPDDARPTAAPDTVDAPPAPGELATTGPDGRPAAPRPYAFGTLDTVRTAVAPRYEAGAAKKFFFGGHYRDAWSAEVDIPVLDLETTAGGLTPIKKGGGLQTVSLRLQGADGDQYVLRSVDKRADRSLPPYLLETVAQDVVQDQNSAMFPFGAFIVPPLADAAGVLHTSPRLVVVPDSPRLGRYREEFAGMVALLEARPDEDQSDEARFGYAPDVIGSPRMFEKTQEDNDFRVVEPAYARARLLDMLIGDWDRHKDQWRWAEYEPVELDPTLEGEAATQGKRYIPIPRDRDFAFFRFDGPLALLTRLTGNPHFRRLSAFSDQYSDLFGLNYNGAALDRRFTASLTRADWIEAARQVQAGVTDSVIETAVRGLPPEIYALEGETLVEALKARRDELPEAASEYYELLAEHVDVIGSDKHERFEVVRRPDGAAEVTMYKTSAEGEIDRVLQQRVFLPDETDEIRLYGRGGNDTFVFEGNVPEGILVRAIGGAGEDAYLDEGEVGRGRTRNLLYDTPGGDAWTLGPSSRAHRTTDPDLTTYYPSRFEKNEYAPLPAFGYNVDDGLFLGAGLRIRTHGWRTAPFQAEHTLLMNYALRTESFNVRYDGLFIEALGEADATLSGAVLAQDQLRSYFGLGNETDEAAENLYRGSLMRIGGGPGLVWRKGPFATITVGPRFEYANVEPADGFPETGAGLGFSAEDLQDTYLLGARAAFNVDGTDTLAATQQGVRWLNTFDVHAGVRADRDVFARVSSELSYFYTLHGGLPLTLALRAGGATIVGDFPFHYAHTLGGERNLRGYSKTRFAGRSAAFSNVELRLPVYDFNAYVTRGEVGVFGFFDTGRVWTDDESSSLWHRGYGVGLWTTPFYRLALTSSLGFSEEGRRFNVSLGFLF